MTAPLRILITNDDGVDAPGLAVMRDIALSLTDDVWVVAPDGNQSGAGHRITFGRELKLEQRSERIFAVHGGSPADCVVAGMTHVLKDREPTLVLSGVNNGQNLGDIVHCSGTAAGAREAALQGALGIAISQGVDYLAGADVIWDNSVRFGRSVIESILTAPRHRDVWFNVNIPFGKAEDVTGLRVVGHQRFSRSPLRYYPSHNEGHFFMAIPETPYPLDPELDFALMNESKAITVTPVSLQMADAAMAAALDGKMVLPR